MTYYSRKTDHLYRWNNLRYRHIEEMKEAEEDDQHNRELERREQKKSLLDRKL